MAETLIIPPNTNRVEVYKAILPQIESLISDEPDLIANLANIAAVLKEALGFFWAGFYINRDDQLVLGPFQGPLACTRISFGSGVCGQSALKKETILVPDVNRFPGHIACSSASRSEIVVPLIAEGEVKLVLDVDSDKIDDFSQTDSTYLNQLIGIIKKKHFYS